MAVHDVLISRLKDYENNPRNNDLAVEKVKYSIERFGFLFPVIIDMNYIIVAGHTRVRACRELGIQAVPCIIADELTEEQVNLFRLVDNKTSEYSDWDFEKLKSELAQVDLTLDKNQILLERFELTAEVFDIEPEQAEIKIPAFNFMNTSKPKPNKPQISTVNIKVADEEIEDDETEPEIIIENFNDNSMTSAEDIAQHIAMDNNTVQSIDSDTGEKKPHKPPAKIQFRFGEIAFFISQAELDCLNAKYSEYIDSGEILKRSFVDYLLE